MPDSLTDMNMETVHFGSMEKFAAETVTGIGKFDGVHLGHRAVLKTIVQEAESRGLSPAVFTFREFPAEFYLCGWDEKLSLLKDSGVKICFWCDLDEVVHMSRMEFLDILLASGASTLVVGYDFHFGAGRKGNIQFLREMQQEKKFKLIVVPPQKVNGAVVNSSETRRLIKRGEVEEANNFLGRHFSVSGTVIEGISIGRTIGFPTANLALDNDIRIGEGVYAGWALLGKKTYKAAVVTGVSPTFHDGINKFEVFLIGFESRNIYGEKMKVFLSQKMRNQIKFPDKESLKLRIAEDVKEIESLLSNQPVPCYSEIDSH